MYLFAVRLRGDPIKSGPISLRGSGGFCAAKSLRPDPEASIELGRCRPKPAEEEVRTKPIIRAASPLVSARNICIPLHADWTTVTRRTKGFGLRPYMGPGKRADPWRGNREVQTRWALQWALSRSVWRQTSLVRVYSS